MKEWFQGARPDEQPPSRFWGWSIVGWLVVGLLLAAGLAWSAGAFAADLFEGFDRDREPMAIRLYERPCAHRVVVKHLKGWLLDVRLFKRAALHWKGKHYAACWALREGVVIAMDEEGAFLPSIPRSLYTPEGT